jgi:hypothetical protein
VSRVAEGKDYGLVVDYWGVLTHLQEALAAFTSSDVAGALRPKSAVRATLDARHRTTLRFFQQVERTDIEACLQVLKEEEARAEFDLAFRRFAQSMNILWPDPGARQYLQDFLWLAGIREMARVRFQDERLGLRKLQPKVRLLIHQHVQSQGLEPSSKPSSEARASSTGGEDKALGFDETGVAISRLLDAGDRLPGSVPHPGEDSRDLARRILAELEPLLVIDWTQKEEVRRKMRAAVKARLRQAGFSRDSTDALVPTVMDIIQARLAR